MTETSVSPDLPDAAVALPDAFITVTRLQIGLIALAVLTASVVFTLVPHINFIPWPIALVVALILSVWLWLWPPLEHRYTRYWLDEDGLYIQKGVLWRRRTLVPRNRVQHTDVGQGPLQRQYGLGKLVVHTAGTRDASVTLSGLDHGEAVKLRNTLIDKADDDAV